MIMESVHGTGPQTPGIQVIALTRQGSAGVSRHPRDPMAKWPGVDEAHCRNGITQCFFSGALGEY